MSDIGRDGWPTADAVLRSERKKAREQEVEVRSIRRYEIAKAVLAGFATNPSVRESFEERAEAAVLLADALLAELEK